MDNINNEEQVSKDSKTFLEDIVKSEKEEKDKSADKSSGKKKDKKSGKDKKEKKFNGKKLKHGTMATVFTCVFLALLVLVNVVTTMLFDRYPITIDLTSEKIYSVSDESEEYVKNVDVDVMVTIFADEETYTNYSSYNKQAVELLKNYCKLNHHIDYRFMDIDSNPEVVKSYSNSIQQFDIIFETNTEVDGETIQRTRKLGMIDLLSFNEEFVSSLSQSGYSIDLLAEQAGSDLTFLAYYGNYVESSNAEQAFTSALMTVTDPNPIYVTILTGRNEIADLTYFQTLLVANGYNVNSVDITSEDIPENTDIIVLPAPKNDYLEAEIAKISDFLNNDGNLGRQMIYIASYSQDSTPNLDEFLEEYGLSVGEGVICETYQANYYNYPYITTTTNLSDSFDQDIETSNPVVVSEFTRPVNVLFEEQDMVSTNEYILSTDDAYTAALDVSSQIPQVGERLEKGQQCYFAVGSKAKFVNGEDTDTLYSNVLCFGSEYLLNNNILSAEQYNNREYILSVLNGITHKTDGVTITPKTITGSAFDINEQQKRILMWTFSAIIPGVVLITGIVVWIRRKNK
ncbi:MAG: GldG family protein [Ruminococcus sp.]|nr:GldG family protein [Ruminococcus sp.]